METSINIHTVLGGCGHKVSLSNFSGGKNNCDMIATVLKHGNVHEYKNALLDKTLQEGRRYKAIKYMCHSNKKHILLN